MKKWLRLHEKPADVCIFQKKIMRYFRDGLVIVSSEDMLA